MKKIIFTTTLGLLMATFTMAQCGSSSHHGKAKAHKASWSHASDIVDVAVDNKQFSTLVAAVTAAELVETLKSDGPFTVFAPTNAAFDKLPDGTLDDLLKKENKGTLSSVLTYHVIAGEFKAADVIHALEEAKGDIELETVNGGKLVVTKRSSGIFLKDEKGNYSQITATDVEGSNGVIHVIDTVVMPG